MLLCDCTLRLYRRRRRNDEKNVILPLKFSLKGALSHTVVPTLPWLLSHHIFGHIYIFTEFFVSFPFTSSYDDVVSVFYPESDHCTVVVQLWQLLRLMTFWDQVLKGVDETGGVSNNLLFGLIQVWGHTVCCGLVWTPKSVIFVEAFSTSLLLYIYHWRRLDTFDTSNSQECISTTTSKVKQFDKEYIPGVVKSACKDPSFAQSLVIFAN